MATNFGPKGVDKPAPKGYRRFERAMLIIIIPAGIFIVQSWGFKDQVLALKLQLLISTGLTALVKGLGMMLSNDEIYVDPTKPNSELDSKSYLYKNLENPK